MENEDDDTKDGTSWGGGGGDGEMDEQTQMTLLPLLTPFLMEMGDLFQVQYY